MNLKAQLQRYRKMVSQGVQIYSGNPVEDNKAFLLQEFNMLT